MIVRQFTLTPFQQHTRIIVCPDTAQAICIDPGEASDDIVNYLKNNSFILQAITLTHGHLDHVGGTLSLHKAFPDADVILHRDDEELYYGLQQQPLFMGLQPEQLKALGLDYEAPPQLTRNWHDGEIYNVGNLKFEVKHSPGHTLGHVVLAEVTHQKVFVGDCLFAGSVGRTDLPGGNHQQLLDSINKNLLSLDDDVVVYSGHGPETTIGRERVSNPFLNGTYQIGGGRYV